MRETANAFPGDGSHAEPYVRDGGKTTVHACLLQAESLLDTLKEESGILERFQSRELLDLLPRKEALTRELHESVRALKNDTESAEDMRKDPDYAALKGRMDEIVRINHSNLVFIQGSLGHFRDFLDCIMPSGYGPGRQNVPVPVKGLTFRKEV